jgi:heme/copper-type cytochrome/quinol oxidase subunit 1
MLTAKLFAILAILQFCLALLESKTHQSTDILFHATYFVIGHFHLQILLALASSLFGLIYCAASRWVLRPLNGSLSLIHFVLVVLATIGFALLSVRLSALGPAVVSGSPAVHGINHWTVLAAALALLCFLLGCGILAMNCGLTAIMAFQSRNR